MLRNFRSDVEEDVRNPRGKLEVSACPSLISFKQKGHSLKGPM